VLNASVDLQPTLSISQQYTCQLKMAGHSDLIDYTPVLVGTAARLNLNCMVHLDYTTQLELDCGTDAPARFLKGRIYALRVDVLNPGITLTPGQ
jgi:hypothetical protein